MLFSIVNGCGHMWFLPMLFWCFIGCWVLEHIKLKEEWKLLFLIILNLFAIPINLPFQLMASMRFMLYFYGGYQFYKYKDSIRSLITKERLVLLWMTFFIVFFCLRPFELSTDKAQNIFDKINILVVGRTCRLLFAWLGIVSFYCSAVFFVQRLNVIASMQIIASCSMGIYLFQQFILKYLYYHTGFSVIVGPYWLPWCGFLIAMAVSFVFSVLMRKTKWGRFLIG